MRIGSSQPLLPTPVSDRGYGSPRTAPAAEADAITAEPPRSDVVRMRNRSALGASQPALADSNLSQRGRNALQSYLANGPTLSERLGVELAGIDVLV